MALLNVSQFRDEVTKEIKRVNEIQKIDITLSDGTAVEVETTEDRLRHVVYDNEIQVVRNVDSFVAYAMRNPNILIRLIENATWAMLHDEEFIEKMYGRSHSNRYVSRLLYVNSNVPQNLNMLYNKFQYLPISSLVMHSIGWLKGLVISKYGVNGIAMIKEAENAGFQRRVKEINPEMSEENGLDGDS